MTESHHPDGEDAPDVDYEGEEEADAAIIPPPPPDGIDARPPSTPPPGGGGAGDSETEDDDDDDDAGPRPPVIRGGDPAGAGGRGENGEIGSEVDGGGGGSGAVAARVGGGDVESSGKVAVAPPSRMDRALDAPREAAARGGGRGGGDDDGRSGRRVGDRHGDRGDRRDAGRGATTKRRPPGGEEDAVGAYIPPAKRRLLEEQRKAGEAEETAAASSASRQVATATPASVQRRAWEDLRRLINGTINRLSPATIKDLIHSLFSGANLVRGRGLLASSVVRASSASPRHAPAYAALMAVVSSKLPECGELLLARAILAFRRGYKRRDRDGVSSTLALLGHLFNQGMAHELLSLQILTVLLDGDPTEDSVDVAVGYMCVVGRQLAEVSPAGVHAVMERFRGLLHEGSIGRRAQYRIETLMRIRKGGFADYPTIPDEEHLDLVEREDQITFELGLDDEGLRNEEELDSFHYDDEYDEREEEWKRIKAEILGEDSDGESGSGGDSGESGTESEDEDEAPDKELAGSSSRDNKKTVIIEDLTETDLVHLRRTIYLTIMSSATFEECTHKLAKMDIPPGRECELINMIIECCSQERTFLRYYGMVSGRFCLLHERWQNAFEEAFATQYNTIHRLETNKLRNVAKLFGHLLHTDSFSWSVLGCIHLNEDETTSSSRIFIKILVQEMAEAMGMVTLKQRFDTDNPDPDGPVGEDAPVAAIVVPGLRGQDRQEPSSRDWFRGMFPKDNARNTRYAINFFTSIGLGPLTDGMREFLKNAPKLILAQAQAQAAKEAAGRDKDDDESSVISTSSSDTSSASSSSSGSSMSSSSSSSSSYTSSSSNSSYSSYSRKKSKAKGGRDRKRSGRRSRSYSSYSSSDAGRKKYSSRDKRGGSGGGRRRGRASSDGRDGDHHRSRSRSRSRGGDYSDKRRGGNGRDERRRKSPPASSRDMEERSNKEAGRKKRARSSSTS